MTGYAIFNIEIKKPEEYKEYVEKVKPVAEMYGGEYIVRAGETVVVEGTWTYLEQLLLNFQVTKKLWNGIILRNINQSNKSVWTILLLTE